MLADVYIDESGSADEPNFSVGGLVLFYTPEKKKALQLALKNQKLEWSVCEGINGIEWPSTSDLLPKEYRRNLHPDYREKYEAHLAILAKCFRDEGVQVLSLGLRVSRQDFSSTVSGIPMNAGDIVYRRLLGEVLELALASIFSLVPDQNPLTVNIHAAVRWRPIEMPAHEVQAKAAELFQKFGMHSLNTDESSEVVIESLRSDDVWPLVMDILNRHQGQTSQFSLDVVRGVRLLEYEKAIKAYSARTGSRTWDNYTKNAPLPEQLHYLADWVARFATWEWNQMPPTAQVWFQAGFHSTRTRSIQHLLQAKRCIALNSLSQALIEMYLGWPNAPEREFAGVHRWIACHTAHMTDRLTGSDFQRFWNTM
jgi:hypothetical protein